MKRMFGISWVILLVIVESLFVWLRLMPINVLNYHLDSTHKCNRH